MALTKKQEKFIRSKAQTTKATVQIGKNELGSAVIKTVKDAVEANELVKVSILASATISKEEALDTLQLATSAQYCYAIGNQLVIYKKSTKEAKQVFSKDVESVK